MRTADRNRLVEALSTIGGALRLFFFSGYTVGFVEVFRRRGAYDVNNDGRTDSFADKFLDNL